MNRRDFLRPRRLAEVAGQVLGAVAEPPPEPDRPADYRLLRASHRAMAANFEVLLPYGLPDAVAVADAAFDEIDRLERQLTVYRDDSEVSELNRLAPERPVPVERGLFDLLALAARFHADTGGAHDVTAGALVKAWGFYKGPRRVPTPDELTAARERTGMRHVLFDAEAPAIRYLVPGLEINLGSIGKGYALDRAGRRLREEWGLADLLLHGGTSSVLALGDEPGGRRGWPVGIAHPWDAGRRLAVLRLRDQALGTSAATFQYLEHEGRKLGHVLDPRTGWPAEAVASASVVAPTAAEADALSTAFFILGVDGARAYCERHPDVGAVLLPHGADQPVVLGAAVHRYRPY